MSVYRLVFYGTRTVLYSRMWLLGLKCPQRIGFQRLLLTTLKARFFESEKMTLYIFSEFMDPHNKIQDNFI